MNSSDYDIEPLLEPKKYDPSNPHDKKATVEDVLSRYKSVTGQNPYVHRTTPRDAANSHGSQQMKKATRGKPSKKESFDHQHFWILPSPTNLDHPALRNQGTTENGFHHRPPFKHIVLDRDEAGIRLNPGPKRTLSQPLSPSMRDSGFQSPTKVRHVIQKSHSDTSFFASSGSGARLVRSVTPAKLNLPSTSPSKAPLPVINEQDYIAANYKVQVREHPDSDTQIIRSPLKRLFGEGGLLGRSTSGNDLPDPRYRKKGLAAWGGKVKQRVEEIGKDLSEKFLVIDTLNRSSISTRPVSTFPVTLSPYVQGDFYMQLELLLNLEANNFLLREYRASRLSVQSVKTIVERWANKGRPQVLGFRFDLITQRELAGLNADTVQFAGVNAFTRGKALAGLAAWSVLAKELAVRTFCQPDSAVKKHLHDAEKVLELIDAEPDSMLAFQEMRTRVVTEIYRAEKAEKERKEFHGIERAWSPEKFGG